MQQLFQHLTFPNFILNKLISIILMSMLNNITDFVFKVGNKKCIDFS